MKNALLAVVTLGLMVALFIAYQQFLSTAPGLPEGQVIAREELPVHDPKAVSEVVEIGPGRISGGRGIDFRRYDPATGEVTDALRCESYAPIGSSRNELYVKKPQLFIRMPSGMLAVITAEEGRISADRIEKNDARPRSGTLQGNARVVLRKAAHVPEAGAPAPEDTSDQIVLELGRVNFDADLGSVETDSAVRASGPDFDIRGTGLHLRWNRADNRVESLVIDQGESMQVRLRGGLLAGAESEGELTAATQPAPDVKTEAAEPPAGKRRTRPDTTYLCSIRGSVVAEQVQDGQSVASLRADELRLLFDLGPGARSRLGTGLSSASTTTQPTGALVSVRWSGPLHLSPGESQPSGARRRLEALGEPVVLTHSRGEVRCGRLAFQEDTQQTWIYPQPEQHVEFQAPDAHARAASIYVDHGSGGIKLMGPVVLQSRSDNARRGLRVDADLWAELQMAKKDDAVGEAWLGGQIEGARFEGDVRVSLDDQRLQAHQFHARFRPAQAGETMEQTLTRLTASGDVRSVGKEGELQAAELVLDFARNARAQPSVISARGNVVLKRDQARILGQRVMAFLAPPEDGQQNAAIRMLAVEGNARLVDSDNGVAARGNEIQAEFSGVNSLETAQVVGEPEEMAWVRAGEMRVYGEVIAMNRPLQSVEVEGVARLALRTDRTLRGEPGEAAWGRVTCQRGLKLDGRANTAIFEGDVRATRGNELLRADRLTLHLQDVAEPVVQRGNPPVTPLQMQIRHVRAAIGAAQAASEWVRAFPSGPAAARADANVSPERFPRKEITRIVADNALAQSETPGPQDDLPLVHSSIESPRLEVQMAERLIRAAGPCTLLMIDRRDAAGATEEAASAAGVPYALLTRGASQTAMRSRGDMLYSIGETPTSPVGAATAVRRDTVLFEGGVFFAHRAADARQPSGAAPTPSPNVAATDRASATGDGANSGEPAARETQMESERLECVFEIHPRAGGAAGGARLRSLNATHDVYLRDQQRGSVREIWAQQLEFDREQQIARVIGGASPARLFYHDLTGSERDTHAQGPEFIVDLGTGKVRTQGVSGEVTIR